MLELSGSSESTPLLSVTVELRLTYDSPHCPHTHSHHPGTVAGEITAWQSLDEGYWEGVYHQAEERTSHMLWLTLSESSYAILEISFKNFQNKTVIGKDTPSYFYHYHQIHSPSACTALEQFWCLYYAIKMRRCSIERSIIFFTLNKKKEKKTL